MLTLNDGRNELWQWDTGRKLEVDVDCSQVHFSNKVFGRSIDVDVVDGVATIPDILLQTDKELNVWAFVGTAENGYTKISKIFKVNRRNKPADYVFTPTEQTSLEEIKEKIEYLESIQNSDAIKNAVEDYLEQNPVDAPVQSVNGKTGKVSLTALDVGAISQDDLQEATNKALEQAKKDGLFDGPKGDPGDDYVLTEADKDEIAKKAAALVEVPDPGGNVDYAAYGLPILHLAGDTSAMTKDNAVDLAYVYGERNGTCSVKWQGSSSLAYDKKNYTIKFDNAFEAATGWGAQKKYCFKANYIDHSHARNIVNAKLWGQIVKSRENVPERLKNLVNGGAIDGFPCIIMLNGEFHGLYTWNIPKDGWMLGMGNSNSATTQTGALVNIETEKDAALRVSADAADTVTLVHHGKNYFPGFVDTINRVGITFTPNEDKTATFSGTNNGGATVYIDTHYNNGREFFLPAGLYYLSGNVPNQSDGVAFYVIGSTGAVARLSGELYGYRFRLDEGQVLKANFSIPGGVTVEGDVWIQIEAVETGGEATDFEPSQRTDVEVSLPVSVDALNGTNILYTTTGDVLTVNAGGNEYEAIVCASGNSAGHAIEGFKQTVSEWDTGFDLEYIADESDEGKATAMQSLNNLITACINSDGTDLDAIGTMLDWDSAIDYYIFATMIAGHDMQLKNYLLYTFNGTKWYFGGYDMDCTYGLNWNGGSWVAAHYPARFDTMAVGHRLFELIKNYKKAEVKARYAVIKQNVMSENNVYLMFSNFIGKIPSQVYLEDAKRWPMIPNTSVNNISQILNYYRMRLAGCDIWVESNHR